MAIRRLTEKELHKGMADLAHFSGTLKTGKLTATFNFKDHVAALVFVARITVHAEVEQHHPEITYTHRKVKVVLTTSDVKGVTSKDIKLAHKIERLVATERRG